MKQLKIILSFLALFVCTSTFADVRLPRLISDSMILQRDAKVKVWGWASANEKVSVSFAGKKYKATTAADGKWMVQLAPLKAGGPYIMNIAGNNHVIIKNILMGDVWFCAGQSNMVHQMVLHKERYQQEIFQANEHGIRHFFIPTATDLQQPKDDLPAGSWKAATPENVKQFSAVAYFFAKSLYEKYKIPIGLINASVGGTPIEAWTSEEGLKDFATVAKTIQKNKDTAHVNEVNRKAAAHNSTRPKQNDNGLAERWFETSYVPKGWRSINVPGYWEDQGIKDLDGIVWYRKEINLPASMAGVPSKIAMGRIVDADFVYVNGKLVGNTGYQYPQRRYEIPAGMLKAGKNIIVVRVINEGGKGGFVPDKPYYLAAAADTINLKGEWQYKVGDVFVPWRGMSNISFQNQPTALYNAMVAPAINYNIKGILWYQGESNVWTAAEYEKLLPALISDWRSKWKLGDVPFLFVQLPNFQEVTYLPSESSWAVLREAQLKALSVPNTGMAVAIDLGEWNDIHPDNKKDVGVRLALSAQKVAYGDDVVFSGPIYQSSKIEGKEIILTFNNTGSGLITIDNEEPGGFAIAGADKKFVWAKAKMKANTVVVWNDDVAKPMYVRYAWADNPHVANLYNNEGLPASPFRTDTTSVNNK